MIDPSEIGQPTTALKDPVNKAAVPLESVEIKTQYPLFDMIRILLSGGDWVNIHPPQSTLAVPNYNREMARAERHFEGVAIACVASYAILVQCSYKVAADTNLTLTALEQSTAFLAFVCLLVSVLLQLLPLLVSKRHISGVVFAAITVQCIAMVTNAIMAFGTNTPILLDPVTGARVHLLRWSEWTTLSFLMTFLVEASDIPDPTWGLKLAYTTAASQGLSTICGWFFPICPNFIIWIVAMTISCVLYLFIFIRLRYKEVRFTRMKSGTRLDETELYTRCQIALYLFRLCAAGWTFLVVMYFAFSLGSPLLAPEGSLLRNPAVPMISEAFTDVVLKVVYMTYIVTMHTQVFEESARTKRRLEELRQMMWDNSSDVLAISVQALSGVVTTMVSPTFFRLLRSGRASKSQSARKQKDRGMIFEMEAADFHKLLEPGEESSKPQVKPKLYDFDFGGLTMKNAKKKVQISEDDAGLIGSTEMLALARLLARSWLCGQREALLSHDLVFRTNERELSTIQCEAKVTRLEESAMFVVMRDISERFRRFEAEKLAVLEMTARKKDSEANRFTRHEVKNGLLAAIGLCDSLADTVKRAAVQKFLEQTRNSLGDEHSAEISKVSVAHDDINKTVEELDSALHEVLDTIMAEAMARDVIHEAYEPQLERLDMVELLRSMAQRAEGKVERFPVTSFPSPFPMFWFDQQLLKCIHRNAVSNACKYGARGQIVKTHLSYDNETRMFQMDVTNLPGENYEKLLQLGMEGSEGVFAKGKRLHPGIGEKCSKVSRNSSGDGAWIMRQCATTLGGDCSIDFRNHCTVFTFRCPASTAELLSEHDEDEATRFKIPKHAWGIALDDSKMQRKLLNRYLEMAGFRGEKILIRGNTNDEITNFDEFVVDMVERHPNDYFLLIVDENLDMALEDLHQPHSTVSGSLLIQKIRHQLLPEQEQQILALVRSANDSSHDIAIYKSRAHGFMAKAPIKKASIVEVLGPLWKKRFAGIARSTSMAELASTVSSMDLSSLADESTGDSYLAEQIRAIDSIVQEASSDDNGISEQWPLIWEKLHAFKGDLLSSNESDEAMEIVHSISDLRGRNIPIGFLSKWNELRLRALAISSKCDPESDSFF